jgi:hypothetical protein
MKILTFVVIGLAVITQLFYDLSPLLLSSMASADGVAVYPKTSHILVGFFYRCMPYFVFAICVAIVGARYPKYSAAVTVPSILGVISPLIAILVAGAIDYPVGNFREKFWPIRPVFQLLVFIVAGVSSVLFSARTK